MKNGFQQSDIGIERSLDIFLQRGRNLLDIADAMGHALSPWLAFEKRFSRMLLRFAGQKKL
jgi:hypothetical protein